MWNPPTSFQLSALLFAWAADTAPKMAAAAKAIAVFVNMVLSSKFLIRSRPMVSAQLRCFDKNRGAAALVPGTCRGASVLKWQLTY